jgi:hypothetical protein
MSKLNQGGGTVHSHKKKTIPDAAPFNRKAHWREHEPQSPAIPGEWGPGYHAGSYYGPEIYGFQANDTPNQSRAYVMPMMLTQTVAFSSIAINCNGAQASSTVDAGLYADDGNGYPGVLLGHGVINTAFTGDRSSSLGAIFQTDLSPGLYWIGYKAQNLTTASFQVIDVLDWQGTRNTVGGRSSYYGNHANMGYYQSGFGAADGLPNPFVYTATFWDTGFGTPLAISMIATHDVAPAFP